MTGQLIDNWNELFEEEEIPQWEDLEPNVEFCSFLRRYIKPDDGVLELGSGLGHNAIFLAKSGLKITASDISSNAVKRVGMIAETQGIKVETRVLDILNPGHLDETYRVVFDKGCFHSFFTRESRLAFANAVYDLLPQGGYWISSIGSADNQDASDDPYAYSYPRLSLEKIATIVESLFEIVEVRKGHYGHTGDRQFITWECAFVKR